MFEVFRIIVNAVILGVIAHKGKDAKESAIFSVSFGILVCFKWLKLLREVCSIRSIGMRILPIMITLQDVGPFCGVVLVYLLAATNAYYSLGLKTGIQAFIIIFRITFLGDVDLNELEAVSSSSRVLEDQTIQTTPPESSQYHEVCVVFMLVVVFVMSTALMNIFIAVLSNAYDKATNNALTEFLRAQAGVTYNHHIMMTGLKKLRGRIFGKAKGRKAVRGSFTGSVIAESAAPEFSHLWYFSPEEDLGSDES